MPGRGRPRKLPEHTAVLLRLPDDLLHDIDAWRGEIERDLPGGATITRADLMRHLLEKDVRQWKARKRRLAKG